MNENHHRPAATVFASRNAGHYLRSLALVLCAFLALQMPVWAQQATSADDDKTHFEVMPYLVLGAMGGDVRINGRDASFSQSATDILSNLQFGAMGRARFSYRKWFVGLDGTYMGLGAANDLVDAGVDQVIVEPSVGYKVTPMLEAITGARYNKLNMELNFRGPAGVRLDGGRNWWDPFVGGRVIIPFGEKYSVSARLDFGGFGAGSKIAVNAEPMFNMKFGKRGSFNAGWKFYYVDYSANNDEFRYAALSQGPLIGATFRW